MLGNKKEESSMHNKVNLYEEDDDDD